MYIELLNNFRGGAELLFDKKKKHSVNLPGNECKSYKISPSVKY